MSRYSLRYWDCNLIDSRQSLPDFIMRDDKKHNPMDSRLLASLLSSLSSQLLLVLLFFFPNSPTTTLPRRLPLLLLNFISSSQVASCSLLSTTRKKKRKRSPPPPQEGNQLMVPPPHVDPFKVCFRMASSTFEWLTGLLEPLLECRDPLGSRLNLPPEIRLGIGLFRLATGSDYTHIARRFGVSESVTRFCTKQLCRVLCTNFRFWVAFPAPIELESVSTSFLRDGGSPNCCGVIGCTRFKIKQETVVAQIVVDNSFRILNIVAGFRGDKAASRVLRCSTLYKDVEQGRLLSGSSVNVQGVSVPQYFVGDQSYHILPWLMVPFSDPVNASLEEHYNVQIGKMRLPGLTTFASLRSWGILNKPIEEEYKTAVACIGACSILHNALLSRDDFSALSHDIQDYDHCSPHHLDDVSMEDASTTTEAILIRNALAAQISKVLD